MGVLGRIGAFITGGLLGAGVGAAIGMLLAPQSGDEFRATVEHRLDQAKVAGLEAEERTVEDLIRRFRAETNDPDALRDLQTQTRVDTARAIVDLNLPPGKHLPPRGSGM